MWGGSFGLALEKNQKIKNQKSKIESKLDAEVADIEIAGVRAKLIKPLTFVDKSGDAVRKAMKKLKLKTENLIVVRRSRYPVRHVQIVV